MNETGNYDFTLNKKEKEAICNDFIQEMTEQKNKDMFLETFVRIPYDPLPQGIKKVVAIKIGSSFLKMIAIKVDSVGSYKYIKNEEKYYIDKKTHLNKDLWEWVAMHLNYFVHNLDTCFEGAVTLSFPMRHMSLEEGYVTRLSKYLPFNKANFIEKNVIEELNKRCKEKKVRIIFKTVLNDAVASAVGSYFLDKSTVMSVVLGTGTNCALITPVDSSHSKVTNLEWGVYDSDKLKKTDFDKAIMDHLRHQGVSFNNLDVLIGGYKFVDICSMYCAQKEVRNSDTLTFGTFLNVLNKDPSLRSENDNKIYQCVNEIKKRTLGILSALIVGVLESINIPNKRFTICCDGHAFFNKKSRMLLSAYVDKLLKIKNISEKYEINYKFVNCGGMVGSAFSLFLLDLYKS